MPTLRQAVAADWKVIQPLLVESGLAVDDLDANKLQDFLVAEDGSELVGLIGLQLDGTIGLLRSLVVAKRARSRGLGGKLVGALESAAQAAGVSELWLLTTDAGKFFERCGYEIMARDTAPGSIQQTEQFSDLCPGTAYLMSKVLS
jgi:N-acetylglutamate synthase-like GNAT family acetyltransferase